MPLLVGPSAPSAPSEPLLRADGSDLGGQHRRVLGTQVPVGPQNIGLREADLSELPEEGTAFLGPRQSREPVLHLAWRWRRRPVLSYQLRRKDAPATADDARQLLEDSAPCRVEIEDPIDEDDVNCGCGNR